MKQQTLLAHLALQKKFSDKYENIAVEALGHILSESDAARHALSDVLRTGGAEVGEIARVKTQASGEEGTRPDLAGFDQHNKERVLIEAKFWAGLTDNQPVAYLERLPENQASALLFVAPAKRFELLWQEMCRLVREAKIDLVRAHEEANLRSATVGGKRLLMLISWTYLLDRMDSRASTSRESHTKSDIQQLQGLAEQMDDGAFLPLRREDLGPEFPRRLRNLEGLVDDVIERLEQKELAAKGTTSRSNTAYGRGLQLSGTDAWFGLDHYKWAEARDTPLWLYLYEGVQPISEIRERLQPLAPELELLEFVDDQLVVPIYPPVGLEYDTVLNAVVARLKEVAELINPAD